MVFLDTQVLNIIIHEIPSNNFDMAVSCLLLEYNLRSSKESDCNIITIFNLNVFGTFCVKQGAHKNVRSDPFPSEGRLQGQELGKEEENVQGQFKEERQGWKQGRVDVSVLFSILLIQCMSFGNKYKEKLSLLLSPSTLRCDTCSSIQLLIAG